SELIIAPASQTRGAERAILRLSGPAAFPTLGCGLNSPRTRVFRDFEWQDNCWVMGSLLLFPGPASATGEDVAEIHLPASEPVVRGVLDSMIQMGARLAEPGEFTRRAFLNGKLDLTQAEAVSDLVNARSEAQAIEAARLLAGELGETVQSARDALASALTELEAGLDFEEGDSQDIQTEELDEHFDKARASLDHGLSSRKTDSQHRSAFRVLMAGAPNAGKSTLFNVLTNSNALTSDEKGTTRDCLETSWEILGTSEVVLGDLPGVGDGAVDARDQAARVRADHEEADLWLLLLDSSSATPDRGLLDRDWGAQVLVVWTKCDLQQGVSDSFVAEVSSKYQTLWLAAETGEGIPELLKVVQSSWEEAAAVLRSRTAAEERQRQALDEALASLQRADELRRGGRSPDFVAEELRAAMRPLGELVGQWTPEDLLDQIFSRFCLGK
ncbi:MAG: 50S ribosome-binding GTPase, partial [Planctomycetota bacterium]|nr:50S ribosome-binding GTPase [Planctomycetota bacterium]